MGRRETVSYPVFKIKCPMCDRYMSYCIEFDQREDDPPFMVRSLAADGFPYFFECHCGNSLMRQPTEANMEKMFENMEIFTFKPRELFNEKDTIQYKLEALEEIFGSLSELSGEDMKKFEEAVCRHWPCKEMRELKKVEDIPEEKIKKRYPSIDDPNLEVIELEEEEIKKRYPSSHLLNIDDPNLEVIELEEEDEYE